MKSRILSVVIPNFNFAPYLVGLVNQINMSRYRSSIEVIIVDGASTDGSALLVKGLLAPWDILISESDDGQAEAIQTGLELATAEWFMFQNSDDIFDMSGLDAVLEHLSKKPVADVVACDQDTAIKVVESDGSHRLVRKKGFRHDSSINWKQLFFSIYYTNQSTIYRRKLAVAVGFDKSFQFAMDYDFVVRFFKRYNPRVDYIPVVLGIQRLHELSKTSRLQRVCLAETKRIRFEFFNLGDRFFGVIFAIRYHLLKYISLSLYARFAPRINTPSIF